MSAAWTPTQKAFERWSIHVITCRVCRVDDSRCERGKQLGETWRQFYRQSPLPIGGC